MAGLRVLYRAAREFYLECNRERLLAEDHLSGAWSDSRTEDACLDRLDRARRRESAMRRASMALVRHINPSEPEAGA